MGTLILRHLRRVIRVIIIGQGEIVPFVKRTFEWGVLIATFLSVLSVVRCHCARLTFHPKLRKVNAVLITPPLITPHPIIFTLQRLRRAGSVPSAWLREDCGA